MKVLGGMAMALLAALFLLGQGDKADATAFELTQGQKESYYKQYTEMVEETNQQYPDADLTLSSLEDFESSYWVPLDEFEEIVMDMAQMEFAPVVEIPSEPLSAVSTKKLSATLDDAPVTVEINGAFATQLVETRQFFSKVDSVTSAADHGTWTQLGYTVNRIDGNRTYMIEVGGRYTYKGISKERHVTAEYYCRATGAVS